MLDWGERDCEKGITIILCTSTKKADCDTTLRLSPWYVEALVGKVIKLVDYSWNDNGSQFQWFCHFGTSHSQKMAMLVQWCLAIWNAIFFSNSPCIPNQTLIRGGRDLVVGLLMWQKWLGPFLGENGWRNGCSQLWLGKWHIIGVGLFVIWPFFENGSSHFIIIELALTGVLNKLVEDTGHKSYHW